MMRWGLSFFGVGNDVEDDIGVVIDGEIKTPVAVDTGLPEVSAFVILLARREGCSRF